MDEEPSTSSDLRVIPRRMNFEDLPDTVLAKIYTLVGRKELSKARRINQRSNRVVDYYRVLKPVVNELQIIDGDVETSEIGEAFAVHEESLIPHGPRIIVLKKKGYKVGRKTINYETMNRDEAQKDTLDETLKAITLEGGLRLVGYTIDDGIYDILTVRTLDLKKIIRLELVNCVIKMEESKLQNLLSRMTLYTMFIRNCEFDLSLISDTLLLSMPLMENFMVTTRTPIVLPCLTDNLLTEWVKLSRLVKFIYLGCGTMLTSRAITDYIDHVRWAYPVALRQHTGTLREYKAGIIDLEPEKCKWYFGRIQSIDKSTHDLLNITLMERLVHIGDTVYRVDMWRSEERIKCSFSIGRDIVDVEATIPRHIKNLIKQIDDAEPIWYQNNPIRYQQSRQFCNGSEHEKLTWRLANYPDFDTEL